MRACAVGLLLALGLSACTHMPGVVKDVNWDEDGNLVVSKCDQRHLWIVGLVIWVEMACREETKEMP